MLNKDISAQVLKGVECSEGIVRHEIENGCRGYNPCNENKD